jgi:photosystem II stability/assembly factor-like uncharacterized protein
MAHHFNAGQVSLWVQTGGPNTQPLWLGCHEMGDVDIPKGDKDPIYCPDPSGPNQYKVVGTITGAAGLATTQMTASFTDELDYLENLDCPITLFANFSKRGRKDVFTNFDRNLTLLNVSITNEGITGISSRAPGDETRTDATYDMSIEEVLRLFEQTITRQSISETASINAVTFCNAAECRTDENVQTAVCESGFAATNAGAGSPSAVAQVLVTTDGSSWAAAAADPFSAAEDISAITCFDLGRDSTRVLVARGTTDGAAAMEIAYSDDSGATWTAVDVGSTNGEYAPYTESLYAVDRNLIVVGGDSGNIYRSVDAGLTWTLENSDISSSAWNAFHFADNNVGWAVGGSNEIARTLDGGDSWSAITGPTAEAGNAALCVHSFDRNRAWVGYDSGTLYYTVDGGTTWSARSFTGSGVGDVRGITFLNETLGYLASDNASPLGTVLWTIDGGYTWSTLTTPTNSGLNGVWVCDEHNFFVWGEANSGTGYIAKGTVA